MSKEEIEDLKEELELLEDEIVLYEEMSYEKTDEYDNFLDELGDVTIGSLTYSASRTLKQIDEIAYNCGFNDWADSRITELQEQIDDLNDQISELEEEQDEEI